jgi:transcriptional regulator with XRE-family HTH domain
MSEQAALNYGQRIRAHRRKMGHTQENLAERIGVTRPAVNRWEKRGTMPTGKHMDKLVEYLNTDPGSQNERHTYQLELPFDQPINIELRISPQRAESIHFLVKLKDAVG